jgi:hypothetical protein
MSQDIHWDHWFSLPHLTYYEVCCLLSNHNPDGPKLEVSPEIARVVDRGLIEGGCSEGNEWVYNPEAVKKFIINRWHLVGFPKETAAMIEPGTHPEHE